MTTEFVNSFLYVGPSFCWRMILHQPTLEKDSEIVAVIAGYNYYDDTHVPFSMCLSVCGQFDYNRNSFYLLNHINIIDI